MNTPETPNPVFDPKPPVESKEPQKPAWLAEALADWERAKEAVSIDPQSGNIPAHLNAELFEFPALVAKWGFRVSEAIREHHLAELYEQDCWGAALEAAKLLLGPPKRNAITRDDLERQAKRDADWRKASMALVHAEAKVGRMKSVVSALQAKREALLSLGANLRSELQADPSLRENKERKRDHSGL